MELEELLEAQREVEEKQIKTMLFLERITYTLASISIGIGAFLLVRAIIIW